MHTDPNWQHPPDKMPWFFPSKERLLEHRKLLALDPPTQKKTLSQRNKNGPKQMEKEGNFKNWCKSHHEHESYHSHIVIIFFNDNHLTICWI